jgi:hypothetical protein
MGYHLAEEVLDRCADLPYREFRVLAAIALDATDSTRQSRPGMAKLARHGNCSMRTARRAVGRLAARGYVKVVAHSGPGHRAAYEVLPIGDRGPQTVAGDHGPQTVAGDHRPVTGNMGHLSAEHGPQTVAHSKPIAEPKPLPSGGASPPPSAQRIVGAFLDWDAARGGHLTRRTIGQLAKAIADLLAEGVPEEAVKRALVAWRDRDQHPSSLHSFADAAMNGQPARSRRESERQAKWARQLERARAADAAEAAGELT